MRKVLPTALLALLLPLAGCGEDAEEAAARPGQTPTSTQHDPGSSPAHTPAIATETAMPLDLTEASIERLQAALAAGDITSVGLVEAHLERIAALDQVGVELNAIQHLNPNARAQAAALDAERLASGPRSPLHGIVMVIKDNYETRGLPTTAGSKTFTVGSAGFAPDRDAHLVARLREAGAVFIGKTTMHEFAYGIITVGSAFGATRNPYDPTRNPGGSSGGTGSAVAAGYATVGMGSDTCGSIRIPAAQNNLVGLRGTQGLSSRRGIVPLSSTQDIGGPIARSVRDLSIVLDATVGYDEGDPQTAPMQSRGAPAYLDALSERRGARIGLLTDWLVQDSEDEAVAAVIRAALAALAAGSDWTVDELDSPGLNLALDRSHGGHLVLVRDFGADIGAYLEANPELGIAGVAGLLATSDVIASVVPALEDSLALGAAEFDEAYDVEIAQRRVVARAIEDLLESHELDALAYPTIRQVAAPIGESQGGTNCRLAANSGLPAISVPAGFTPEGMPVGLELLGRAWDEQRLLDLAYTVEAQLKARRVPPVVTD